MSAMCRFHSYPVPPKFTLFPPESPAVLIHWKVALLISACLDDQERHYWIEHHPVPEDMEREQDQEKPREPEPEPEMLPEAFDSYFHLDRLLKECHLPENGTLQDILARTPVPAEERVSLIGSVAVFCDPKSYPSVERLVVLPENKSVAVGLHPKHSGYSSEAQAGYVKKLRNLLDHPKVCAIGEIGLDHSVDIKEWHCQVELLERILPLVKEDKVLVLHCRAMQNDCGTEVYFLLLHFLKRYLRPSQRIHLHCYTGNEHVLQEWLKQFPRSYFGFTNLVQRFTDPQIKALCGVDESRLLLETDAPYFPPRGRNWSSPGNLYTTAKAVANHRGVSAEYILEVT
ncbi:hypothetical protein KUTeg_006556 [Tegillarca granosa]|uniref:Uncharacterized protein n=1 Tax=Tegillarca granosa TaxID=220873 RepID=A0ABQ9FHW3_TEGGR|nr:hypothetical protein KUTeg_006556 [Tegillarca granosa]